MLSSVPISQLYCKQQCCPLEPNTGNSSFASRLDETDAVSMLILYKFWNLFLTVRFNGHLSGGPGFASTRMSPFQISMKQDDGGGGTAEAIRHAKPQPNCHHQQTNMEFFCMGRMSFLSPNQQCRSTEGKISHSMDLLTPSSPGVFQLCLWPLIAPGYLARGLPCLSSALWCQYPTHTGWKLMNEM